MSAKRLFTIPLLLPLVAISAMAYAGSTITDKSYWPHETRQNMQNRAVGSQSEFEFFSCARPDGVALATRDEYERQRIRTNLSGRSKIAVMSALAQWSSATVAARRVVGDRPLTQPEA